MAENSAISWTDHTFNPWMGCQKVSTGCLNCYAETLMDHRYKKVKWGGDGTRNLTSDANWRKPLRWNRQAEEAGERRRVFCASLADVFENRPGLFEPRERLFSLIHSTPNLDWMILTKRPEHIERHLSFAMDCAYGVPQRHSEFAEWLEGWVTGLNVPRNVWLGTSCENQAEADRRIPHLLRTPAAVRFISAEPLLGPVDLRGKLIEWRRDGSSYFSPVPISTCHRLIDWVIVGGESGHNARPMHSDWARSIRDQCQAAGVEFHFKQWGEWLPYDQANIYQASKAKAHPDCFGGLPVYRVGKKQSGHLLDGREWNEFPDPIRIGTKAGSA